MRTVSGAAAGGGLEEKRTPSGIPTTFDLRQALRHHLWYVVGYNWLVAVTIAPLAFAAAYLLCVVIPEAVRNPWRPPPVAVLCVSGYIFFEVTSFCLERNWSHVSIWRFWRLALPLGALQAFLCLRLARHDALGCLLFMSLCLGCREFLFQLQACYPTANKYPSDGCTKEKLTSAFLGGSAYGMAVALFCGMAGALVHAVVGDGRKVYSALYIDVLIALALPLGRNMSRMALNQYLANATSAAPLLAAAEQPKLDALIMYSDVLFLLTLLMEVPFAFVFLLVPRTITFCLALALNVVVDVIFVQALDVVQRRDSMLVARRPGLDRNATPRSPLQSQKDDTGHELGVWSPTYCIERPESIFATLSRGAFALEPSESTSLRQQPADESEDAGRSCSSCPWLELLCWTTGARLTAAWNWCKSACPKRCQDACCPLSRSEEDPEGEDATPPKAAAMSPRVSLLLDEHNTGVISCWAGRTEVSKGSGHGVFLQQERKIAFTTHFLGSTLAVVIVTVALPIAKHASDNYSTEFLGLRHISAAELAIRAVAVLLLRVFADLVALRLLDLSAIGSQGGEAPTLWQSRQELSTFHAWFFRALAATCPLFAVIAATL